MEQRYGPWALVAGASEGLGAAFALALAERGLNVVLVARRAQLLDSLAQRLATLGVEARCATIDLAAPDVCAQLQGASAGLDVGLCIYNAAYAPVGDFDERDFAQLERVIDVNVRGPVAMAHVFVPRLRARGHGGLVLMSSLAGGQGSPRLAAYAASKAFNTNLAESLWGELEGHGVDALAVCAGAVRTPGYEAASGRSAPGTLDAAEVANTSLDALGRGPRVVPGFVNKLGDLLLGRWLPRRRAVKMMAANTRDLS